MTHTQKLSQHVSTSCTGYSIDRLARTITHTKGHQFYGLFRKISLLPNFGNMHAMQFHSLMVAQIFAVWILRSCFNNAPLASSLRLRIPTTLSSETTMQPSILPLNPSFPLYDSKCNLPFLRPDVPRGTELDYLATHAAEYPDHVFYYNDEFVIVYDGFPKAQVHLLIVPRDLSVRHTGHLLGRTEFVDRLHTLATQVISHLSHQLPEKTFQAGVHAIPSMPLFHLHILSRDLESSALRRCAHWNAMATQFFVPLSMLKTIVRTVEPDPKALDFYDWQAYVYKKSAEEYINLLNEPVHCNRCLKNFSRNITELKKHIAEECTSPLPPTAI